MINIITQEFRPTTFNEVAGQNTAKDLLKAIAKNPEKSPKTLILQGEYGTGKTTCARILAKALNCSHSKNGDACGECEFCKSNIENSIFYEEYDSAIIGNVETIKSLRDTFYFDKSLGYKVIVLDEAQLMTPQAQSALLKVLEDSISNIFFILCTTNIDKILSTIQSRSLRLDFNLISEADIIPNIKDICNKKQIEIDDYTLSIIARRSNGHLRNAHILLDKYILLGRDSFLASLQSAEDLYFKLILNAIRKDINMCNKIIQALLDFPLTQLKQDYEQIVLDIIKSSIFRDTSNQYLQLLLKFSNNRIFQVVDILNNEEIYKMFKSDKLFQAAMYLIIKNIMILYS